MSLENKYLAVTKSLIPGAGDGLFAKVSIKVGTLFTEFKGRVYPISEMPEEINKSTISLEDGTMLCCYPDNLASFANDCIDFTRVMEGRTQRGLLEALNSKRQPFYKPHPNVRLNARIHAVDISGKRRVFLKAVVDIEPGEEVCCHYGFSAWLRREFLTIGFKHEEEVDRNGYPDDITSYPAIARYITAFYPFASLHHKIVDKSTSINRANVVLYDGSPFGITLSFPFLDELIISIRHSYSHTLDRVYGDRRPLKNKN